MTALTQGARGPLTWFIFPTSDTIVVRCSADHPSMLLHFVMADGSLVAPPNCARSLHCGTCNEDLPLKLDGWTGGEWKGPRKEKLPAPTFCDRCGRETIWVGGWGTWSGGTGVICPECQNEVRP